MVSENLVRNCGTRGTKIYHVYIGNIKNNGICGKLVDNQKHIFLIENSIKMFRSSAHEKQVIFYY